MITSPTFPRGHGGRLGAPALTGLATIDGEDDRSWQQDANCLGVDPDLFYPTRGASTHEAKAICAGCTVRDECLTYALRHGERYGIWGATSERERRRLRRARRLG